MAQTAANNRRSGPFTANGTQTIFTYDFRIEAATDIAVEEELVLVRNTAVLTTDYTVTGLGVDAGGTIVYIAAPASGTLIELIGTEPTNQLSEFTGSTPHTEQFQKIVNRLARLLQQVEQKVDRAPKISEMAADSVITGMVDLPLPVAADVNKSLIITDDSPITFGYLDVKSTDLVVTSFIETLLDDSSAPEARATLGVQRMVRLNEQSGGRAGIVSETGGVDHVFTAVDISAFTGANTALFAILNVETMIQTTTVNRDITVLFRQTGTTPTTPYNIFNSVLGNAAGVNTSRSVGEIVVPLDGSQQFDYSITFTSGPADGTVIMDLVGYIHEG